MGKTTVYAPQYGLPFASPPSSANCPFDEEKMCVVKTVCSATTGMVSLISLG
jgi:hypothetical protein